MRWDRLFSDLEVQLSQAQDALEREQRAETERLRLSRISLGERLRFRGTGKLIVGLSGGTRLCVQPETFGVDWLAGSLADISVSTHCVLPLAGIAWIIGSRDDTERDSKTIPPEERGSDRLAERIGLGMVLRELGRRRVTLRIVTPETVFPGTIDRVYKDHIDLAIHDLDLPRRERELQGYRIVPMAQILVVTISGQ